MDLFWYWVFVRALLGVALVFLVMILGQCYIWAHAWAAMKARDNREDEERFRAWQDGKMLKRRND